MKNRLQEVTMLAGRIDSRKMRLIWLLLSLGLFVLGAGAPGIDGGHGT